ncbi:MAG TPA: cupin domain-containing protein [Vineibacter sp.]|nr:cupin domain-containing protein [Vineibacter sp.]
MNASPIDPAWIIDGAPMARVAPLSRSADGRVWTDLWECTAGSFHWHYEINETIHVLDGAATVTDRDGAVWHLKPGDVIQFLVGTKAHWHIPHYVRKVAFCSEPVPGALASWLRVQGRIRNAAASVVRRIRTDHITALSLILIPL